MRKEVSDGRPLYAIDRELLEELKPDLILTQNLCAVCAVSADAVGELCATDAEIVALDALTLAEIGERIIWLAGLLGVPARGRAVIAGMNATIAAVRERLAAAEPRPVLVAEWLDPPYAAGHWIPEMVALAGGRDVLGRGGAPSYPTSWDWVLWQVELARVQSYVRFGPAAGQPRGGSDGSHYSAATGSGNRDCVHRARRCAERDELRRGGIAGK